MTKLCSAFFRYEKNENWLRNIMHSFEVHSNESKCRKGERLGLEQVFSGLPSSTIHIMSLILSFLYCIFYETTEHLPMICRTSSALPSSICSLVLVDLLLLIHSCFAVSVRGICSGSTVFCSCFKCK